MWHYIFSWESKPITGGLLFVGIRNDVMTMLDPGLPRSTFPAIADLQGPDVLFRSTPFFLSLGADPEMGSHPSKPVSCHDVHTSQYQFFKKETQNLGFSGKILPNFG